MLLSKQAAKKKKVQFIYEKEERNGKVESSVPWTRREVDEEAKKKKERKILNQLIAVFGKQEAQEKLDEWKAQRKAKREERKRRRKKKRLFEKSNAGQKKKQEKIESLKKDIEKLNEQINNPTQTSKDAIDSSAVETQIFQWKREKKRIYAELSRLTRRRKRIMTPNRRRRRSENECRYFLKETEEEQEEVRMERREKDEVLIKKEKR